MELAERQDAIAKLKHLQALAELIENPVTNKEIVDCQQCNTPNIIINGAYRLCISCRTQLVPKQSIKESSE